MYTKKKNHLQNFKNKSSTIFYLGRPRLAKPPFPPFDFFAASAACFANSILI